MIHSIRASDPRFHALELQSGLNLIVAEKSEGATSTDSTNALGKTSLVDLMHFALGATGRGKPPAVPFVEPLADWDFSYELQVGKYRVELTRSVNDPLSVRLKNAPEEWDGYGKRTDDLLVIKNKKWSELLGREVYGLTGSDHEPSFRELIAQAVRYEDSHFEHLLPVHSRARGIKTVVLGAWLLGLAWELPARYDVLAKIQQAKKLTKKKLKAEQERRAELLAEEARLVSRIRELQQEQAAFGIAKQSELTINRIDELTREINRLNDTIYSDQSLLKDYSESLASLDENVPDTQIAALYQEAEVWLSDQIARRLEDVRDFHRKLVINREKYLKTEIKQLEYRVDKGKKAALAADLERRPLIEALASEDVIKQYIELGRSVLHEEAALSAVRSKINELSSTQAQVDEFERKKEEIEQAIERAHHEYSKTRSQAQQLFSRFVDSAFHERGSLIIDDMGPKYTFKPDLPSIGSGGVKQLAIACFDLVVARTLHRRGIGPKLLVHDSRMFAQMDPRQLAGILRIAHEESIQLGYIYTALLNQAEFEAARPYMELEDPDTFVRLRLRDHHEGGSLFGFRFSTD